LPTPGSAGWQHEEDEEEESKESNDPQHDNDLSKDPEQEGPGNYYSPKTRNGKAMAKMPVHLNHLLQHDANTIMVYFGIVQSEEADRLPARTLDNGIFTQWQKHHPNCASTAQAMVLHCLNKIALSMQPGPATMPIKFVGQKTVSR